MARVLVVDDEPLHRAHLVACFDGQGHDVVEAADGDEALAAAGAADLVLLDATLPAPDGVEVLRRLKARFREPMLPVVLVTDAGEAAARAAGLAAGADGLVTRPLDRDELLARAASLLALRERDVELARRHAELDDLHRAHDDLLAMLVHDLKSPLAVILASADYAATQPGIADDTREALEDIQLAGARISRLIGNILETAHAESGQLPVRAERVALRAVVDAVLAPRAALLRRRGIAVEADVGDDVAARADRDLLARVVENLVESATRAATAPGRLRVWTTAAADAVELRVAVTGAAIPPAIRPLVFEKFTQVWQSARGSVGLGLYFCRLVAEAHGGRVWIDELPDLPVVFGLSLPGGPRW